MKNDLFKQFVKTGKIADYLKYREEYSKELEKEKKKDGSKGNSNKKS